RATASYSSGFRRSSPSAPLGTSPNPLVDADRLFRSPRRIGSCGSRLRSRPVPSDPARSYESIDDTDLARLGRAADADLDAFFSRNPHLRQWRRRVGVVALAQGAAEHRLRGTRGIWDLDIIVSFSCDVPRQLRRMVVSWD